MRLFTFQYFSVPMQCGTDQNNSTAMLLGPQLFHSVSKLFRCSSFRISATPLRFFSPLLLCGSSRRLAIPLLRLAIPLLIDSWLRRAFALLCESEQLHCQAELNNSAAVRLTSFPLRFSARLCFSNARLISTRPSPCNTSRICALAKQGKTPPSLIRFLPASASNRCCWTSGIHSARHSPGRRFSLRPRGDSSSGRSAACLPHACPR